MTDRAKNSKSYKAMLLDLADCPSTHHWTCDAGHCSGRPCTCHRPAALRALAGELEQIEQMERGKNPQRAVASECDVIVRRLAAGYQPTPTEGGTDG